MIDLELLNRRLSSGERIIYTIYDKPDDYPDRIVVRGHLISAGKSTPLKDIVFFPETIEAAQKALRDAGKESLGREVADEPQIVESWI